MTSLPAQSIKTSYFVHQWSDVDSTEQVAEIGSKNLLLRRRRHSRHRPRAFAKDDDNDDDDDDDNDDDDESNNHLRLHSRPRPRNSAKDSATSITRTISEKAILNDNNSATSIMNETLFDNNSATSITTTTSKNETLFAKEFHQFEDSVGQSLGKDKNQLSIKPKLKASFTFAAYANDSPLLAELIRLGVDLTKWEKGNIPDEVMLLNLENVDLIVRHIRQLGIGGGVDQSERSIRQLGIGNDDDSIFGQIFTQNPHILINGLAEFKEKTDYFLRKKFSPDQLAAIMTKAPYLFGRSVESIDARLGFFQRSFAITGDQIRDVMVRNPKLFRISLGNVKKVNFHMNKFLGFRENQIRELFVTVPSIFTIQSETLQKRVEQLHDVMMIPRGDLIKYPYLLEVPLVVCIHRHKFLSTLGKAVYDPADEGFTSLSAFTVYEDERFAEEFAGVEFQTYKNFMKTL